jgi:kumamolisin
MRTRLLPILVLFLGPALAPSGALAASTSFKTFFPLAVTQQVSQGYTASDIQTAYDAGPLLDAGVDGTGETIALLEWGGFDQADISAFDRSNGLPDATINEYYVGGSQFPLDNSRSARGETTLDLEWAHAMAPGATLNVYYLNNNVSDAAGWREIARAVTTASNDGAGTISISFGICSPGSSAKPVQTALAAVEKRGVSVFVASGDSGAFAGPKKECGSAPGVTYPAVGGRRRRHDPAAQ